DYASAIQRLDQVLADLRAAADERGEGQALMNLGVVRTAEGRIPDALAKFEAAAAIFERIDEPHDLATALRALAGIRLDSARALFRAADAGRAAGDAARVEGLRAQALAQCADSRTRVAAALAKQEEFGLSAGVAASRGTLGQILM